MGRRCFCGCGRGIAIHRLRLRVHDSRGREIAEQLRRVQALASDERDNRHIARWCAKGEILATKFAEVVHRERDPWSIDDAELRIRLADGRLLERYGTARKVQSEIAAGITIVAEVLTLRATFGVASAGIYLRIFIEPHVPGLNFQTRNRRFVKHVDGRIHASWGFAVAYLTLSAGIAIAWFTIHLSGARGFVRSALVIAAVGVSAYLTVLLPWVSRRGWKRLERAWKAVAEEEWSG